MLNTGVAQQQSNVFKTAGHGFDSFHRRQFAGTKTAPYFSNPGSFLFATVPRDLEMGCSGVQVRAEQISQLPTSRACNNFKRHA